MRKKGISLIVLIITIVVIIILAAAVILTLNKNNPIESAKKATFVGDLSAYQDELSMYIGQQYIDTLGNFDIKDLDGKKLEEILKVNSKYNDKFMIKDGKVIGTDNLTNEEKEWASSITGGESGSVTPSGATKFTDSNGKVAYIPLGFTVSSVSTENKVDTGLVIKDVNGNEFVWVPVDFTSDSEFSNKFVKKVGYWNGALDNDIFSLLNEPLNYGGVTATQEEQDEYAAMVESVKKYHGYYIARYQTSNDGNGNAQSKANQPVWTGLKWSDNMKSLVGGATGKAREMYPETTATTGSAVSTLIYGVQWDVAIDFIENYGIKDTTYRKDSTGKGNYSLSRINTGSNQNYKLNNIYDMAGNYYEWCMENYKNTTKIFRGGLADSKGSGDEDGALAPVSSRMTYSYTNTDINGIAFRIALYIK